ncbi:MAG: hypothetical protein N2319_04620 [Candidatus Kapabacteria bacterium]|nr:hypothetical protein [Candidatus Kapabacteria bacterium]
MTEYKIEVDKQYYLKDEIEEFCKIEFLKVKEQLKNEIESFIEEQLNIISQELQIALEKTIKTMVEDKFLNFFIKL